MEAKELSPHNKRCKKMADKYGKIYSAFDEHVQEAMKNDDIDEWKNVRVLYDYFKGKLFKSISAKRETKRQKVSES